MKPLFKVGDICVAYMDPTWTDEDKLKYNGEECTVVAVLQNVTIHTTWEIVPLAYRVEFGDNELLVAKPHELRRKSDDDWVKQKIADLCFPMPIEFLELTEA